MTKVKLKEIVDICNGSTPSTLNEDFFNGDIAWLTPKDLSDQKSKYIFRGERNITELGLKSIGNKLLPIGTILFSSRAPIGLMSIAKAEVSTNQGFKNMVCKKNKIAAEYLFYLLKTKTSYIQELGTGTTFKEVSKKTLDDFELYIEEDIKNQEKIAAVLSALDDKIELNNQINAELEAMAKTLYDYWFVQFDFPVVSTGSTTGDSDAELVEAIGVASGTSAPRGYKSSGGKMVYNEVLKREIPEGWEVKSLNYFTLYQPQTISDKEMDDKGKYFVFGANGIIGKYGKFNHSESEIVITCRGNSCGNIIRTLPECWITGNAMVVTSSKDYISKEFIYQMLHWIGLQKVITGSGQPQITRTNLEMLNFILPDSTSLEKFNKAINANVSKRFILFQQNQELAQLRDWLLPMLMNGQVAVGELEEKVGMVAEERTRYE